MLYSHPGPHMAFATVSSFSRILLINPHGPGISPTHAVCSWASVPCHLSLEGPVFSWISGHLITHSLRPVKVSRRITMVLLVKLVPVKRSDTLFSFSVSQVEAKLDVLNMERNPLSPSRKWDLTSSHLWEHPRTSLLMCLPVSQPQTDTPWHAKPHGTPGNDWSHHKKEGSGPTLGKSCQGVSFS